MKNKAMKALRKVVKSAKREHAAIEKGMVSMHSEKCFLCIKMRNDFVQGRLAADFENRRLGHASSSSGHGPERRLYVLPASSLAYFNHADRRTRKPGFPSKESSGIPQVRQWVATTASPYREKHLDESLNIYRRLFDTIQDWCSPGLGIIRLTKRDIVSACEDTSRPYYEVSLGNSKYMFEDIS